MSRRVVLIPVYNEEMHLPGLLERLRQVYSGDVLFVDDGSCDRSVEVLVELQDSDIRIIRQQSNRGYGATLIRGFAEVIEAGYEFVVTMDSDGQHRPDWIAEFFRVVEGWDVVSGSRYLQASAEDSDAPPDRRRINQTVTNVINQLTGFALTDSFCGFKAYRVSALKKLSLQESGYSMPLQFWIQAKHFGLRVTELPVSRIYDDPTRSFGADLDDPSRRLKYYLETITVETERWKI
jgi:glycosyltransferase involved in cell wall biosynthesis